MTREASVRAAVAVPVEQRDNRSVESTCRDCGAVVLTWAWFRDAGGESQCLACWRARQ